MRILDGRLLSRPIFDTHEKHFRPEPKHITFDDFTHYTLARRLGKIRNWGGNLSLLATASTSGERMGLVMETGMDGSTGRRKRLGLDFTFCPQTDVHISNT